MKSINYKKIFPKIIIACLTIFFLLILPSAILAETWTNSANSGSAGSKGITGMMSDAAKGAGYNQGTNQYSMAAIAGIAVRAVFSLLGVIFLIYTIYGGFLWMTAAGNEEKVSKAKNTIRDGIIGLFIIFGAWAIYYTVTSLVLDTK